MWENTIEKILRLSKKRVKYLHNVDNRWFYKWYVSYIEWLKNEFEEMKKEVKINNSVYLEDELWDVFWTFSCLLSSLEEEWLIEKQKVFERCYKKFIERLWENADGWKNWDEVKIKQKEELKNEHTLKYNN